MMVVTRVQLAKLFPSLECEFHLKPLEVLFGVMLA